MHAVAFFESTRVREGWALGRLDNPAFACSKTSQYVLPSSMLGLLRGPAPGLLGAELACPDHYRPSTGAIRARRACKCPAALPVLTLGRAPTEVGGEVAGGLVIEECSARPLGFAQEPARMQEAGIDSLPKTLGQVWK